MQVLTHTHTHNVVLYVGGGVNIWSDPVKEWEETVLKSRTILDVFGLNYRVLNAISNVIIRIFVRLRRINEVSQE